MRNTLIKILSVFISITMLTSLSGILPVQSATEETQTIGATSGTTGK